MLTEDLGRQREAKKTLLVLRGSQNTTMSSDGKMPAAPQTCRMSGRVAEAQLLASRCSSHRAPGKKPRLR
eukprot:1586838-Pyramimonas_sp.AAC.1